MRTTRRAVVQAGLTAAAGAPTVLLARASGYTRSEIDALGERGALDTVSKHDLPTPSLLLDLDRFEANVDRMARHAKAARINLRPHAKTHKCPEIAKRQIQAGALGVCATTIREAEAMSAARIPGILITAQMVGPNKIKRLVALTKAQPDVMSVVDHPEHVRRVNEAAAAAKVTLNVLIDVDPGGKRTGIPAGENAVALAQQIARASHLKLRGICCYSGGSAHVVGYDERRKHSHEALASGLELYHRLRRDGMALDIFSGGSTGTYNIDVDLQGMTELQVGSYIVMDVEYLRIGGKSGPVYEDFAPALTVVATVISRSHADLATVDAGFKAFATDRRFGPELKDVAGVTYRFGGDEHGILEVAQASREIKLGDRLEFIVPHCDPNVNLYDRLYCIRGERVETVWKIERGYA